MKNFLLLLIVLSATSCAQSTYRYGDDYGDDYRDRAGYARYEHRNGEDGYYYADDDYGDYYDDYDDLGYADNFSDVDIDFNLNLNWNAFPDRYGIAYGAAINGPYRYPRVGFYYQHNWYPSAWWGSYSAFDPWYSDYYYRHRGSHLSLSFNFYDFDDDWDDPWFDAGWGYALGYNWFRPAYGWNPWRRHHNRWYSAWYDPFYRPWHGAGYGYGYGSRYHRSGSNHWVVGPHFTPIYRGEYGHDNHRRTDHIDTRSEAARLAARRPYANSHYRNNRYSHRSSGQLGGNTYRSSRYQRQNNPRNVATRQYKRPYERQRSTRSTHRYDRVPASSQPFTANRGTVLQRNTGRTGTTASRNRLDTSRHSSRLNHNSATRDGHTARYRQSTHKPHATTSARAKPLPLHSSRPLTRSRTETQSRVNNQRFNQRPGQRPAQISNRTTRANGTSRTSRQQTNRQPKKPLINNINRYRSPANQRPQHSAHSNRYQPPRTQRQRATTVRPNTYRPGQQHPAVQLNRSATYAAPHRPAHLNRSNAQRPINQRPVNQRTRGGFSTPANKPAARAARKAPAPHRTREPKKNAASSAREHVKKRNRH